jgi:tetratricopeptide (TPR) repeat protein
MKQTIESAGTNLTEVKRKIVERSFSSALTDLQNILSSAPEDTEALYMLAVAQRYSGDSRGALDTLEQLKRLSPSHGRAHQEEGHVHRDAGEPEAALRAYTRAIQLNPGLAASLRGQVAALKDLGWERAAIRAQAQLERLQALPEPLVLAMDLMAQNKLLKAEVLCRAFLQKNPSHVEAIRLLADIAIRLGILEDAEFLLESAVDFEPDNSQARMDYIQALRKRQKFAAALSQAEHLLSKAPDNPQFRSLCAIQLMQTGDFDAALSMLDEVLSVVPGDAVTLTTKGHALKTHGRSSEAVQAYRDAMVHNPEHGEAYYSLANLKTYRFSDDELARMQDQEQNSNLGDMARVYVNFALAKAYEDRHEYQTSFDYYARGNRLKKAQSRYDAQLMHEEFEAMKSVCTAELFERHSGHGFPAPDPIFILGLPRAGSTLLEQILSSHSQVDGTLELPNILSLSQRLRRKKGRREGGYPAILDELQADEIARFGAEYIEDTRIHRGDAAYFIDKMPNNFRHIGLIKLILPNAKIIDARRSAMACCVSGFKQLFAEGQEFSYDLEDIGRYYREYVDLMEHWDAVLPGHVLRVNHEDVVDDLEGEVGRILQFCGLPFETACLNYYETVRDVRTPSSEQVRQPIFRDGVDQWRHFEPWLAPLKAALGQKLVARG